MKKSISLLLHETMEMSPPFEANYVGTNPKS